MQPPLSNFRLPVPSPSPTAQTVIVGTLPSRTALHPSLHPSFHVHHNSLLVDLHILPSLYHHPTWRYIAIVCTASELYTITQTRANLGENLTIFAVPGSLRDALSIRLAALQHLSAPGVVLVNDGNRARDLLYRLIAAWRSGADAAAVRNVWGEPAVGAKADIVLPPLWDSLPKIQAVLDANGILLDDVLARSCWGTLVPMPEVPVYVEKEEDRLQAEKEQRVFGERYNEWLNGLTKASSSEEGGVDSTTSATERSANQQPPQADFFQRLLAGSSR